MKSHVSIHLPGQLADLAKTSLVRIPAESVKKAIFSLNGIYPGMAGKILTDSGEVRPHVLIFVDETEIKNLSGLETPLSGGENLSILPAYSGG